MVVFSNYPKTDLKPFNWKNNIRDIFLSVLIGVWVGVLIFLYDRFLFKTAALSNLSIPAWAGALASLYGAINEEVFLRLFLFSLIYFLLSKTHKQRDVLLWTTNILVALIFGLGHLPAAFKIMSPSNMDLFRILLLNGIGGIAFGWLYWTKGLWSASLAHFITDIVIHMIFV